MVSLFYDGRGCDGSGRSSRVIFYPDIFVVSMEYVCCVSDVVVIYAHKVHVWVRCAVAIVPISKNYVYLYIVGSL